jgi:carbon storage regulator
MLVLSRKLNEKIRIGPDVWITVIETRFGKVRLGIEAPQEVTITKGENVKEVRDEAAAGPK